MFQSLSVPLRVTYDGTGVYLLPSRASVASANIKLCMTAGEPKHTLQVVTWALQIRHAACPQVLVRGVNAA